MALPSTGRGYLAYGRRDADFNSAQEVAAFNVVPGNAVHVSVAATVHTGNIRGQLCVICYFDDDRQPQKYWSESGHPVLEFHVPDGVVSTSVALLVKGRGRMTVGAPVVQEGTALQDWKQTVPVKSGRSMKLLLRTRCAIAQENSALIVVQFFDAEGNLLLPTGELPINPRMGNYFYLETSDSSSVAETAAEFTVPEGAIIAHLEGRQWKPDNHVTVVGELDTTLPIAETSGATLSDALERLRDLDSGAPLIVLYTTAPPVDHPTLSLRPNRLALEYRKLGFEVVFFPFSRITDEQRLTDDGVIQFNRVELDQANAVLADRYGASNLFICSSYPDIGALTTLDLLKGSGWRTVYEVRDEMEDFNRVGYSKWFDPELERQVVNRVDRIITVSPRLAEKMQIISRGTIEAVVVQNAAPPALICKGLPLRTLEVAREREQHRIIGYIGHLTDSWFDWDLLIRTALNYPELHFEIIGHGIPGSLELPENIDYLGPRHHDEFIEISRRWIAGLIPFQETPLTYAVDPNKVYEYLAVGLRTVTAPMGAVATCPSTYIYETPEEFPVALHKAVSDEFTEDEVASVNAYIESAGWEVRARRMIQLAGLEEML